MLFSFNAASYDHLVQMHLKGLAATVVKSYAVQRIHFIPTLYGEVRNQ